MLFFKNSGEADEQRPHDSSHVNTITLIIELFPAESHSSQLHARFGVFVQFYDDAFNSGRGKRGRRGIVERRGPKSWGKRPTEGIWLAVIAIVVVGVVALRSQS